MLLHQAVQRGLLGTVTLKVDRGAIRRPGGAAEPWLARVAHSKLWCLRGLKPSGVPPWPLRAPASGHLPDVAVPAPDGGPGGRPHGVNAVPASPTRRVCASTTSSTVISPSTTKSCVVHIALSSAARKRDRATAQALHVGGHILRREELVLEVDGDAGIPAFGRGVFDAMAHIVGRVVQQHSDRPEALAHRLDRGAQGGDIGQSASTNSGALRASASVSASALPAVASMSIKPTRAPWAFDSGSTRSAKARPRAAGTRHSASTAWRPSRSVR